ncbi:MAG: hypothetical protein DMF06_12015 [Verrucomicrobia bacterium]|nr:MAG: hypothetical protein DMF06_12015 [Verrucomicrobiota bacterium]
MTKKTVIGFFAIMAIGSLAARAATLIVDDNLQCPGATYPTIQGAVTAASPGDTIKVCPGTYVEQVMITKNLKVEGIAFNNENLALVMPAPVGANSTSLSGNPVAAIILVDGASNVSLTNLTVDGAAGGLNGCDAPTFIGVYYRNASGKMDSMAVRNIRLGAGSEGCQNGLGIFAQSGNGGSAKLEVVNSSVHDYQKNGITANEVGTELTAKGNAVTGFGPSPIIAQNGIQLAYGAKGTVESNSVINHVYSPATYSAAGILVYASGEVKVKKNNVGKSQVGVDFEANGGEVSENVISDTDDFDGVYVLGNNNKIENNTIFNSDESGAWVDGNNNTVKGNTINEAPIGVHFFGTGNGVTGNKFFNTGMNTDSTPPPPAPLARSIAPTRVTTSPLR